MAHTKAAVKGRPRKLGLHGSPEWEAMKAVCRDLPPPAAVRECADLSAWYRRRHRVADVVIDFDNIVSTLQKKKIPFVLTGAHGISTWTGRPRATHDVDILVKSGSNYARAVRVIRALYPGLEERR